MSLYSEIIGSFKNNGVGLSARKSTAFVIMLMIVYSHMRYVDRDNVVQVIIIDSLLLLLLLGLVTFQQVIEFKNGPNSGPTKNPE